MAQLAEIVAHLDRELRTSEIADYPGAWNGLQIENSGAVTKIGAAVDACIWTIERAVEQGISLLIVHHGLFWPGVQPMVGAARRKMKVALEGDLAIYSAHLPLDLHPRLGNNALLCRALGFGDCVPFLHVKGQAMGLQTVLSIRREDLTRRLTEVLGRAPHVCAAGPEITSRIGVVTGGAGGEIARAFAEGVDTFVTGEGPHHSYVTAEELGVNLIFGGHYATEVFGVTALSTELGERFGVPSVFFDHPTGM